MCDNVGMPSISDSISRALNDNRVSIREMKQLLTEAKSQPLTKELKNDLQKLLDLHADKFGVTAKRDLEGWLRSANVIAPPPTPRDLADPTLLTKHTTDTTWKPVDGGQLYVDGISYDDVVQGSIANCYMVGAFSAVAQQNPDAIKNAIKDNGDGTYTVSFFENQGYGRAFKQVSVTVDGDMATSASGTQRYGKSREKSELWVGVLEKAYAEWKGGYETIGNGGYATEVLEALTGNRASATSTTATSTDALFSRIERASSSGAPITAGTHGKDSGVDYNGTGVYAWHVYTVLGTSQENGAKYVELRNPWGNTEPGNDGKNDGIFKMKMEDFVKLYSHVHFG